VADQTDPPGGELEDRVERLETGQTTITGKLDEVLAKLGGLGGQAHDAAAAHEAAKLDRPSSVEEQVRAELARAEAERKAAADADADKSERQQIKDTVAKLTEVAPVPPQPRRERLMWGGR
jgi:uncharacterized protein (UPF0335 family)